MRFLLFLFHLIWTAAAAAQSFPAAPLGDRSPSLGGEVPVPVLKPVDIADKTYRLGPHDTISVSVLELEEVSVTSLRITPDGLVALPLVGRMAAAGMTIPELETKLTEELRRMVHEPHVTVGLVGVRSRPVTVLGAVKSPGIYQIEGRARLLDVLTMAGGLREDAGYRIRVSRRIEHGDLPLPQAHRDAGGAFSIADIDARELTEELDPAANVELCPNDTVSAPKGKMVYVLGAVLRPGGLVLAEREQISVLEVLALAGGLTSTAAKRRAKILRSVEGRVRREEIDVDLQSILKTEGRDVSLESEDILLIPESGGKKAAAAASAAALSTLPTVALWRLIRGN